MRVKNLRGTSGCPHIGPYRASADAGEKCATNGCGGRGNRACHVIAANQSAAGGHRVLVYMCAACNASSVYFCSNAKALPHCAHAHARALCKRARLALAP